MTAAGRPAARGRPPVRLDGAAAVAALHRAAVVGDEEAAGFVEAGDVLEVAGSVAVVLPAEDPATGEPVLYVPVCAPPPAGVEGYADLADGLAALAAGAAEAVVRIERSDRTHGAGGELPLPPEGAAGWRPVSVYLEADPAALERAAAPAPGTAGAAPGTAGAPGRHGASGASGTAGAAPGPVAVTEAQTAEERGLVRKLLTEALVAAAAAVGETLPGEGVRAAVDALLAGGEGEPPARSLVARVAGRLAGHATYQPGWTDEVDGTAYHRVVDVFVLEDFRGAGVTGALTTAVAARARRAGEPLLGEVSWDPDGLWQGVLGGLEAAGWRAQHALVRLTLPGTGKGVARGRD